MSAADLAPPRRGRPVRWWLTFAVAAAVVLGLTALVGWRVVANEVRADVTVRWSGPLTCKGTRVVEESSGDAEARPVVRLRDGMRCVLPVRVENASRVAVDVTRVRLPLMGPEGGAAVQVSRLAGRPPVRPRSADAVFAIDELLAPGESLDLEIILGLRPDGCTAAGSTFWAEGRMPAVRVVALGRPGTRSADGAIGFRGTRESAC